VTESFSFQPICEKEEHAMALLGLLEGATARQDASELGIAEEERLEAIHYRVWMNRRSEHIESVTRSAEVRLTSLKASHDARVGLLQEQRDQASDARIRRMKEGQLDAANRDYERRRSDLKRVAGQADIVAEAAVLGILYVEN
jgi:hypothetical protein